MPDPVSYFELGGQDATGLREFYAGLFGWKIQTPLDAAETGDYSRVESSVWRDCRRHCSDLRQYASQLRNVLRGS